MSLPCGLNGPDDTRTFLDWYVHAAGRSWVPPEYHVWCAIAAVAAAVGDRVYFEKFRGERLTPNVYVMLIGPSGVGKNQAIRRAQKLVERAPSVDRVGLYRGKISAQALLSWFGDKKRKVKCIWLVTPELAMQLGSGAKAEDFIVHMTEMFDGDTALQDYTRTSGHFVMDHPTINWTPGTTPDWLLRSMGKADILGGAFARIFPVPGERIAEADRRALPKPILPDDYEAVTAYLVSYLDCLMWVEGQMVMDAGAEELHAWWIETRPEPTDESLWHFYSHGDNLLHKLAMILALADEFSMTITYDHLWRAIALYEWVYERLGGVLEFAHRTPEVERLLLVLEYLQRNGGAWVEHTRLVRFLSNRGITVELMQILIRTLVDRQEVAIGKAGSGGRAYRWIGNS